MSSDQARLKHSIRLFTTNKEEKRNGKANRIMDYKREDAPAFSVKDRIKNYKEFHEVLTKEQQSVQGARCMDCGVPFCQSGMLVGGAYSGCPLNKPHSRME